ncbi:MAG TPA: TVP38/TMEM64 family protein [Thermoanaerobaculia bacterium]|nr:TVP38/TMEM64 family protein [Thermoanaerobaculia bacterium]
MPKKQTVWQRAWKVLAGVVTIAFPFLVITLLPVGKVVTKLDVLLDRLGPFAMIGFAALYILDALILGPAWLFALVAGLAFGLAKGILLVWASATTAAVAGFLISRYFARHRIEKLAKKNEKYEAVDRAIKRHGWKVILLLRASPLLPYTVSNYIYGLTAVDFLHYLLATAVGLVPMVAVYVSIGAAGREAALAAAQGGHHNVVELVVLGVGIVFTVAAVILITRAARRELAEMRVEKEKAANAGGPPH